MVNLRCLAKRIMLLLLIFWSVLILFALGIHVHLYLEDIKKNEVKSPPLINSHSIHKQIIQLIPSLERKYITNHSHSDEEKTINTFISNLKYNKNVKQRNLSHIWKTARSWISPSQLYDMHSPELGRVVHALKTAKIIKADVSLKGTQFKLLLTLEGNQSALFKPKWYPIDKIMEGPVYGGKDRHSSEIVAFYLSALYGKPLVPITVERKIGINTELFDVATRRLHNTIFRLESRDGSSKKWCVYGKCKDCKKTDPVCEDSDGYITGAMIFYVNANLKSRRSPWQRTYKEDKNALWEADSNYCGLVKSKLSIRRILDLIDVAIFDFLIQNGDRHDYMTLENRLVWLDNGKGFGNPKALHMDILAPLYQCCMLRNTTENNLLQLAGGFLPKMMEQMPDIEKFLTRDNLNAMDERLLVVYATIEYCKRRVKNSSNKADRDLLK